MCDIAVGRGSHLCILSVCDHVIVAFNYKAVENPHIFDDDCSNEKYNNSAINLLAVFTPRLAIP